MSNMELQTDSQKIVVQTNVYVNGALVNDGGNSEGSQPPVSSTKVLKAITASKTKKVYNVDEDITVDDVTVTALYTDGTSESVTDFITNVDEIDTFTDGLKQLVISYSHNGIVKSSKISINVKMNSADNKQYAYSVTKTGMIIPDTPILKLTTKLLKGSIVNIRYRLKVKITKNNSSKYTTIGLGSFPLWNSNTTGSVVLAPGQVGEFIVEADKEMEFTHENISPEDKDVVLLYLKNNGNKYVDGTYELLEYSISVTQEAPIVLDFIKAHKTEIRYFNDEQINTDDIVVVATYADDTTKTITEYTTDIDSIPSDAFGDVPVTITYTENSVTKTDVIKLRIYAKDLTEPQEFNDITAFEMNDMITFGINVGNNLDSKGNEDYTCAEDGYLDQEVHWGQPELIPETFEQIANHGFNTVRIPVTWFYNSYVDADGVRHIGKFWAARVREVVDMALNAGLIVVMNCHHEQGMFYAGVPSSKMERVLADVKSVWTEIAEKFKHYNEKLIFEGFNEVDNLEASWQYGAKACAQMNMMNQAFVDAVRATGSNNSKRILIAPTLITSSTDMIMADYVTPIDTVENKLMTTVHIYTGLYLQDIESKFIALERFMNERNIPVLIGEWGTTRNFGSEELRAIHAGNYVGRAKMHGIKAIWWDNGSDYSILPKPNKIIDYGIPINTNLINSINTCYNEHKAYAVDSSKIVEVFDFSNAKFGYPDKSNIESTTWNYWGALTMDAMPVFPGNKLSVTLTTNNNASADKIFIHSVVYYDSNKEFLSTTEIDYGRVDYTGTVPEDAAYCRVDIHSPHKDIKESMFTEYLANGDVYFTVESFSMDDIYQVQLEERVLDHIQVSKSNVQYDLNDTVVVNDITVTAVYNDGFTKVVTEWTTNNNELDMSTKGMKDLIVTYIEGGITATESIQIACGGALLSRIDVTKSSTTYYTDTELALDDIAVTGIYTDNSSKNIDIELCEITHDVNMSVAGKYVIIVNYVEDDIRVSDTVEIIVKDFDVNEHILDTIVINECDVSTYELTISTDVLWQYPYVIVNRNGSDHTQYFSSKPMCISGQNVIFDADCTMMCRKGATSSNGAITLTDLVETDDIGENVGLTYHKTKSLRWQLNWANYDVYKWV